MIEQHVEKRGEASSVLLSVIADRLMISVLHHLVVHSAHLTTVMTIFLALGYTNKTMTSYFTGRDDFSLSSFV